MIGTNNAGNLGNLDGLDRAPVYDDDYGSGSIDSAKAVRRRIMDGLKAFLEDVLRNDRARGHFLGLLHILIGRTIAQKDGTVISKGLTWRDAANLLKTARYDPDAVRELNIDPAMLPPRDRQRFWFQTIAQAGVASAAAIQDADRLTPLLERAGYIIGPAPGTK